MSLRHSSILSAIVLMFVAAHGAAAQTVSALFPAVNNQDGFDTRLVLDNTSGDDPTLTPRTGACTLEFYGATSDGFAPPGDLTTAPIPPGGQLDLQLSAIAPDLAGYIIAGCDFSAAEGKAILTDGSAARYESPAEVIARDGAPLPLLQFKPLLFSYATNAPGFDTRIILSNTTRDKLGALPVAGKCRIDYFGQNAPASQTSLAIPPGSQLDFTLSEGAPDHGLAGAPGFQGYLTAACEFARARGLAMVTQYQDPGQPAGASPVVAGYSVAPEVLSIPIIVNPVDPNDPDEPPHASALLLPFVSSRGDYRTDIAVSNTSLDALGTIPEPGTCTLNYHGDSNSPALTPQTFAMAAAEQIVFPLGAGHAAKGVAPAPGFQGYLTLSCDFERARANALLSTGPGAQVHASASLSAERLLLPRNAQPAPATQALVSGSGADDWAVTLVNTSIDGFGSAPSGGACVISYQGASGGVSGSASPPSPAVAPLPPGAIRRFLLSRGLPALGLDGAPGFQGYLSTACDFSHARVVDYRVPAAAGLPEFCDVDGVAGVQPSDTVALTNRLNETVALGDPADPDGDGLITDADVQYCNSVSDPVTPGPTDPEPTDPGTTDPGTTDPGPTGPQPPSPPAFSADLGVELSAPSSVAEPGRRLDFELRAYNLGPNSAPSVTLTVSFPASFTTANPPSECIEDGSVLRCNLGAMTSGASRRLSFSGAVSSLASSGVTGYARIDSPAADPNPGNNAATHSVPLFSQADIAANAYFIPLGAGRGRLTVSVTNRGPARAEGVLLEAAIAPSFTLRDVPRGCAYANRNLRCEIGGLTVGRTRAFLIEVGAAAPAAGATTVTGSSQASDHKPRNNTYVLQAP